MSLALAVVLIAALVAAATDVRSQRIPNALTVTLALAGLIINAAHGWPALLASLAIMVGVLVVGLVAHAGGWMGGGDVKLMAAALGTLGAADALPFALYTLLAGGALAIAISMVRGRLLEVARTTLEMGVTIARGAAPDKPPVASKLPYGLAIACGSILVTLSHTLVPSLRLLR
ncbi:pilus assembly protein CpaA [bacterium]|nr:MAG: pilus assembly protein CpaA [bacterium]